MLSSKCGKKCKCFCPVSFGLALGLTGALMVLLWSAWVMSNGMPAGMDSHMMMPSSWGVAFGHSFWVFVKGFVFGFVFAFLYNVISCWCKAMRCHDKGECCDASEKKK